jgi:3,4-dihydroxy 2-butanone 4-phosphate synthase/GTP cyclohydrolase II
LSDDPQLTVRHVEGTDPQPVILDTSLRCPVDARLVAGTGPAPIIATSTSAPLDRQASLEQAGATVLRLNCDEEGGICLDALLQALPEHGVNSLMVEGGAEVITSFLRRRAVDHLIVTVAPMLVGGKSALHGLASPDSDAFPNVENIQYRWIGKDLVLEGQPRWDDPEDAHPTPTGSTKPEFSGGDSTPTATDAPS